MKNVLLIVFTLFTSLALAAPAQVEVLNKNGRQEVWRTDGREKIYLGEIEVWPKGTLLFHWAHAKPEQAEAWNKAGKISPELLAYLKTQSGYAGGGFYVSTNPVDSAKYGNTQVIIELPQETRILRSRVFGLVEWNSLHSQLEAYKISGITVAHKDSWASIIDAESLTKEFVPTSEFYKQYRFSKLPSPDQLKDLFKKFPELKKEAYYTDLVQELKDLKKGLRSAKNEDVTAAMKKALTHGDLNLIEENLALFKVPHVNEEIIRLTAPFLHTNDKVISSIMDLFWKVAKRKPELNTAIYKAAYENTLSEDYKAYALKELEKTNVFICSKVFAP